MPDRVLSSQSNAWMEIKQIRGELFPKLPEYNVLAKIKKEKKKAFWVFFYIEKNDTLHL